MSTDKWATSESSYAQLWTKVSGSNCSCCSKAPSTLWPNHQYTHRTGQKSTYGFIMTHIEFNATSLN